MAITVPLTTTTYGRTPGAASCAVSFPSLPSNGDSIIVAAAVYHSGGYTAGDAEVVDNQGGSYVLDKQSNAFDTNDRVAIWSRTTVVNNPSGTFTITLTPSEGGTGNAITIGAIAVRGMAAKAVVDQTAQNTGGSGAPQSATSGTTPTTTVNDEVVVAVIGVSGYNDVVMTENGGTSFFQETDGLNYFAAEGIYEIVSTTGAQARSWTIDAGNALNGWGACIATYKADAGGGGLVIPVAMHHYRQLMRG